MSTHDPEGTSSSPTGSSNTAVYPQDVEPEAGASRTRSFVLLGILIVLLGALWYDYRVVRPNVEYAYESIGKINSEYNSRPGKMYVTDKEVQRTLNRAPSSSLNEGPYYVEVYSWRSGLPIRTHNYYAVYSAGTPLVFLKHYKFDLPMDELKVTRLRAVAGSVPEGPAGTYYEELEGGAQKQRQMMEDQRNLRPESDVPSDVVRADVPEGATKSNAEPTQETKPPANEAKGQ